MPDYMPMLLLAVLAVCVTTVFAADLPLSRVVLFSSGVGYFEREGAVEGNTSVELSFRTAQINDILKSLVLQDLSGGTIAPVTYAPQDPLAKVLSSFEVDIADNPTLAELWDRLRGAKVRVSAEQTVEGVVVGAEKQKKSAGEAVVEFDVLNLMTDKGLVAFPLATISSIKILDDKLEGDLLKALEALDRARDSNKRPVSLLFKGTGKRTVRVGYLLETPVWKTSYRLVMGKQEPFLQGWAIVENTTDDDWNDVGLAMVSGRPVSFTQNLYEPLYIPRPEIPVQVAAAARPRIYEGTMDEKLAEEPEASEGRMLMRKAAPSKPMAMADGFGGGMGGMAMAAPAPTEMDFAATGAQSMAAAGKIGTLFQYAINQPVTVPRQRSAMIPIISEQVQAWKVSVYSQQSDAKYPMNGVLLKNATKLHLMGGPITVFDSGAYAGDALIEDLAPAEQRLLTYAMDLEVEVDPKSDYAPSQFLAAKLVNGVLYVSSKLHRETSYAAKNRSTDKRVLLIEHPVDDSWKLIQPEKPHETTRSAYRFRMELDPGKSDKLTVIQEQTQWEQINLDSEADDDGIRLFISQKGLSPKVKAALEKLMELQAELADLTRQLDEKATRIKEIEEEQARIRQNMEQLDRQSQLYKDYVEKFSKQETEFEGLREESKALQTQADAKKQEIEDYITNLNVE